MKVGNRPSKIWEYQESVTTVISKTDATALWIAVVTAGATGSVSAVVADVSTSAATTTASDYDFN